MRQVGWPPAVDPWGLWPERDVRLLKALVDELG
ncbi:hypothetical protein QFZ74_002797 [Streptomyces sp. V3I7]|nr:hypothetical protein [Streptomyces sp. V3I7]